MNNDGTAFCVGAILSFLVVLGIHVIILKKSEESYINQAIKAGKAEYYLDENNEKQWRWKP